MQEQPATSNAGRIIDVEIFLILSAETFEAKYIRRQAVNISIQTIEIISNFAS